MSSDSCFYLPAPPKTIKENELTKIKTRVKRYEFLIYETIHLRKDVKIFPPFKLGQSSSSKIDLNHEKIFMVAPTQALGQTPC